MPVGAGAPQQPLDADEQLLELEGLGQVVVGTGFEGGQAIVELAPPAQEQDRQVEPVITQRGADLASVSVGERDVEHEQLRRIGGERLDRLLSGGGQAHRVALGAQRPAQHVAQRMVVLADAHADGLPVAADRQLSHGGG